jgi:transcriptional regulator with XRE-family HTH domain
MPTPSIKLTNDGSLRAPYGTLGNAIKVLREKRMWTQVQLAKRLGLTQSTVASYESTRILPSEKTLKKLASEFNVPIELLLAHRRTLFA